MKISAAFWIKTFSKFSVHPFSVILIFDTWKRKLLNLKFFILHFFRCSEIDQIYFWLGMSYFAEILDSLKLPCRTSHQLISGTNSPTFSISRPLILAIIIFASMMVSDNRLFWKILYNLFSWQDLACKLSEIQCYMFFCLKIKGTMSRYGYFIIFILKV
jgi:hypothetical protein